MGVTLNTTKELPVANEIAALRSGGKRVRIHDAQMVVKLPAAVKTLVEEIGKGREDSGATVVREALAEYLEKRGYRL